MLKEIARQGNIPIYAVNTLQVSLVLRSAFINYKRSQNCCPTAATGLRRIKCRLQLLGMQDEAAAALESATAPEKPVPPALRKSRRVKTFLSTATPFIPNLLLTAISFKRSLLTEAVVQSAPLNEPRSSGRRRPGLLRRFGIDHVDSARVLTSPIAHLPRQTHRPHDPTPPQGTLEARRCG